MTRPGSSVLDHVERPAGDRTDEGAVVRLVLADGRRAPPNTVLQEPEDERHDEETQQARADGHVSHERVEEPEDEHLEDECQAHQQHHRAGRDEADEHRAHEQVEGRGSG